MQINVLMIWSSSQVQPTSTKLLNPVCLRFFPSDAASVFYMVSESPLSKSFTQPWSNVGPWSTGRTSRPTARSTAPTSHCLVHSGAKTNVLSDEPLAWKWSILPQSCNTPVLNGDTVFQAGTTTLTGFWVHQTPDVQPNQWNPAQRNRSSSSPAPAAPGWCFPTSKRVQRPVHMAGNGADLLSMKDGPVSLGGILERSKSEVKALSISKCPKYKW